MSKVGVILVYSSIFNDYLNNNNTDIITHKHRAEPDHFYHTCCILPTSAVLSRTFRVVPLAPDGETWLLEVLEFALEVLDKELKCYKTSKVLSLQ